MFITCFDYFDDDDYDDDGMHIKFALGTALSIVAGFLAAIV